jgi:hypothetical protein
LQIYGNFSFIFQKIYKMQNPLRAGGSKEIKMCNLYFRLIESGEKFESRDGERKV